MWRLQLTALGGRVDTLVSAVSVLDDKNVGLLLAVMAYGIVMLLLFVSPKFPPKLPLMPCMSVCPPRLVLLISAATHRGRLDTACTRCSAQARKQRPARRERTKRATEPGCEGALGGNLSFLSTTRRQFA